MNAGKEVKINVIIVLRLEDPVGLFDIQNADQEWVYNATLDQQSGSMYVQYTCAIKCCQVRD